MTTTWRSPEALPDGHRLFRAVSTGEFAIADDSGHTPELTDDGVLWLDHGRPLTVAKDYSFTPPREHFAVPLRTTGGDARSTPTDAMTLLLLASRFAWGIAQGDVAYSVTAR